jgi:metal-responsive CopG/Arc/MetJ family transcriptional regulator
MRYTMNTVSMRLPDELLREMDKRAAELDISRTEYIRRAILDMNRALEDAKRRDRLKRASLKVRSESMKVNAEFAAIERAPD